MAAIRNPAREKLEQGALSLGCGVRLTRSVEIGAAMKSAGFDWLFIDCEHGTMSLDAAAQIAVAALDAGIAPIVRVPNGEYSMATRVLDNGALGIVMPHVDSAEEAAEVVQKLKYPPVGHRSVAGGQPLLGFKSLPVGDTIKLINQETLVIVMLETPAAIRNADAIAAVKGIDVLLIGTNDLCAEMGMPGQFSHQKVEDAYAAVIAATRRHRKFPGMGGVYDPQLMQKYIGMGMQFILSGSDLSFLMAGASARAKVLRTFKRAKPGAKRK